MTASLTAEEEGSFWVFDKLRLFLLESAFGAGSLGFSVKNFSIILVLYRLTPLTSGEALLSWLLRRGSH
jgi:hypothetical protein